MNLHKRSLWSLIANDSRKSFRARYLDFFYSKNLFRMYDFMIN